MTINIFVLKGILYYGKIVVVHFFFVEYIYIKSFYNQVYTCIHELCWEAIVLHEK